MKGTRYCYNCDVVFMSCSTTVQQFSHLFKGGYFEEIGGTVLEYLQKCFTLPETNIAPENGWLEYYFPIGKAYFQGLC